MGTPNGSYAAMKLARILEVRLGEAEERIDARVVRGDEDPVDHPHPWRRIGESRDDHQLVGVRDDGSLVRVVVVRGTPQDRAPLQRLDDAGQRAGLARGVPVERVRGRRRSRMYDRGNGPWLR